MQHVDKKRVAIDSSGLKSKERSNHSCSFGCRIGKKLHGETTRDKGKERTALDSRASAIRCPSLGVLSGERTRPRVPVRCALAPPPTSAGGRGRPPPHARARVLPEQGKERNERVQRIADAPEASALPLSCLRRQPASIFSTQQTRQASTLEGMLKFGGSLFFQPLDACPRPNSSPWKAP